MSEKRALGLLIQFLRLAKNLTRTQLEELADLPVRSLSIIEPGIRDVDALELQRVASALDLTLDDLVPKQVGKNGQQNRIGDGLTRSTRKSQ